MEWRFGDYVLNSERAELTGPYGPVHIGKQPLDLLILLAGNAGRIVTRDEIADALWEGRFIGDAVISTAMKQARRAVGDSGARQAVIRTVHGRGFRFVAPMHTASGEPIEVGHEPGQANSAPVGTGQASVAVMRFQLVGSGPPRPELTDGLPAELISSLSKLRWLHVTARGSSFQFAPETVEPETISAKLGVRYLLTGRIEPIGDMLTITVELLSAASGTLVWSERYATTIGDIQLARQEIVSSIIAAFEIHVPQFESEHARRLSPGQLDAWSHYHLGLRHMYRYNQAENAVAAGHFRSAIQRDGEFARAHAGLSFTYWQKAFMHYGDDRKELLAMAAGAASRALEIDGHDPFASFNMGRLLWLEGDVEAAADWFDRTLAINPNYSQCHYTKGLSLVLRGVPEDALDATEKAIRLSPLDPLLYAMLSAKALSHVARDELEDAQALFERAVHVPGAHFYIAILAAIAHELSGDRSAAEVWRDRGLAQRPDFSIAMLFEAFPFRNETMKARLGGSMTRLGVS